MEDVSDARRFLNAAGLPNELTCDACGKPLLLGRDAIGSAMFGGAAFGCDPRPVVRCQACVQDAANSASIAADFKKAVERFRAFRDG